MQTPDQGKRPKEWRVVAAIATASALGISGLALAGPGQGSDIPDPINLRDQTTVTEVTTTSSVPTTTSRSGVDVREASGSGNSLDSPFDDVGTTTIVVVDPLDPVVSSSSDSPDVANPPAPAPAPPAQGSADSDSADSGSADSDSADSAGSADNSADS